MKELNPDQTYFVEEFYEDYRAGLLSRRSFIRRIAFITGSMAATIATMSALGCTPVELPAASEPMPTPEPTEAEAEEAATSEPAASEAADTAAAELVPVPGAQSPFSVPEGDPAVETSEVMFTSQGDEITAYLARPVDEGVYPAILVCHENRGLNPHIEDVARRFAKEGYVALAIDLLAREGGTAAHDQDEVPGLLGEAGTERHVADFVAGFNYLQSLDFVDVERIGMTGYCFGGGITWEVATEVPELKAAVPFYGRAPELEKVPNIQAAVLGVYAGLDERINAGKDALEQALSEAGVTHQMNVYPGVNHAFHNDTGQRYVEEQATQAWQDTLAWFEEHL
jgi:carboxymethylenebutenolidase